MGLEENVIFAGYRVDDYAEVLGAMDAVISEVALLELYDGQALEEDIRGHLETNPRQRWLRQF